MKNSITFLLITLTMMTACQFIKQNETSDSKKVQDVVVAFMDAAKAGNRDEAARLSSPESNVLRHFDNLASVQGDVSPVRVYLGTDKAMAVSPPVQVTIDGKEYDGYLMFGLEQDESYIWKVFETDFENEEVVNEEIARFKIDN